MVGLKNGHIRKNVTQNGEPQRCSWETKKKIATYFNMWTRDGKFEVEIVWPCYGSVDPDSVNNMGGRLP